MDVSQNSGTPQIIYFNRVFGFSIINHPFWGARIFGNTPMLDFWAVLFWGSYLFYFFQEPPDPENKETEARPVPFSAPETSRGRTMNKQKDLSCNWCYEFQMIATSHVWEREREMSESAVLFQTLLRGCALSWRFQGEFWVCSNM